MTAIPCGQKKQKQRNDPKPNGDAAVGRNRRDDVEVENGDNEEQNQVALAENPFKMWLGFRGVCFHCQRFLRNFPRNFTRVRYNQTNRGSSLRPE